MRWARAKIAESAPHDGDGEDDTAFWLDKQPRDWQPDFRSVPITPIEKGGPEHRFGVQVARVEPPDVAARRSAADPLDRPVEGWSEEDVRSVLSSPAYLRSKHADHERAQQLARSWFERRFGTGPARVDATGRMARADRAGGEACPVPVRAHTREGSQVVVAAHCRSEPAA